MNIGAAWEINAKCRAMYARLLDRGEYDLLVSMKSVSQIADYLIKQTPYAYPLHDIDINDVHRGQLEQNFQKSLFYDYESLIKFTSGGNKEVLRAMFESYEIDDLKQVISSICSDNEHQLTTLDLGYARAHGRVLAESMLGAQTMDALVANLSDTRYYKCLLPFTAGDKPDFLSIDHALNLLDYEAKLNVFKKSLRGAARRISMAIHGVKSDIENILFIYRTKKLYGYPALGIENYFIPSFYRISRRELMELAHCSSLEEISEKIAQSKYGSLFPVGRESEWEALHAEFYYQSYKKNIRRNGNSIAAALSYLFLKEMDMKNIVMIIEGVRYSLPPERIASFIIGYEIPAVNGGSDGPRLRSYRLTA